MIGLHHDMLSAGLCQSKVKPRILPVGKAGLLAQHADTGAAADEPGREGTASSALNHENRGAAPNLACKVKLQVPALISIKGETAAPPPIASTSV
jgi:hypothetical protein